MPSASPAKARVALALLIFINLLSYVDRYVLSAVIKPIQETFGMAGANADALAGTLSSAFFVSYMLAAPVCGWLADRSSRWTIIGVAVGLWSLATGASGLATGFTMLLCTRVFLGLGEAGYGPSAPTIISDLFPVERRGRVLAWFYMAIPVGSALGYAVGGLAVRYGNWRWAFYALTLPGLLLALLSFFQQDPRVSAAAARPQAGQPKPTLDDYKNLLRIPSLLSNIAAQTAFTFALGGLAFWAPKYLNEARSIPLDQANLWFSGIVAVTGLFSTLAGGWLGDRLRTRFPGAYFLVSGVGMILGFPAVVAMLYVPFPAAWGCIFLAMFFLFLNTGPSNTALANVSPARLRATAFALNILIIHALGDVISPPLIGWIKGHYGWNASFLTVSMLMLVSGVVWLMSMPALARDTEKESRAEAGESQGRRRS